MSLDRNTAPLAAVVLIGILGALWLRRRRHHRDELSCMQLEQQVDLLEIWLLFCTLAAIGAATWAAAEHRFPSGLGLELLELVFKPT